MVDWDGLENRCTLTGTEGSNPSLSANYFSKSLILQDYLTDPTDRPPFRPLYVLAKAGEG